MSSHGDPGDTMDTVRGRFRDWNEANPRPRSRSAIAMPELPESAARMLGLAVGVGTGVLLLLLAGTAFYAATTWGAVERGGANVAYTLAGLFLTIAGLGAIAATLNHLFRVLAGPPAHH
jgi:hypothetical protein